MAVGTDGVWLYSTSNFVYAGRKYAHEYLSASYRARSPNVIVADLAVTRFCSRLRSEPTNAFSSSGSGQDASFASKFCVSILAIQSLSESLYQV
jgi:hypothetical protein